MIEEMTGSLPEAGRPQDRRADERTTTVFKTVLIKSRHFQSFSIVRNLSPYGMMAKVYSDVTVGTPLVVQLSARRSVMGAVVWAEGDMIGVRFNEAVDVSDALTEFGKKVMGSRIVHAPRLDIDCPGEMVVRGRIEGIEVQDISQRGLKAKVSCFLSADDEVMIHLAGLERRKAVVRWVRRGTAGLNFTRPLGMDELAKWAVHQQLGRTVAQIGYPIGRKAAGNRSVG